MTRVKPSIILLIFILSFPMPKGIQAQEAEEPVVDISVPLPGEAVQGLLQISGTIDVKDLDSYILEFAFQEGDEPAWFPISKGDISIISGVLGEWDTSSIPDGNYKLRLSVNRQTEEPIIMVLEGIRVRNYSQIETNTPAPTSAQPTITPTAAESITPTPTTVQKVSPTPLDPNPVSVTLANVQKAIVQGSLAGVVIFIIFLLYRAQKTRN